MPAHENAPTTLRVGLIGLGFIGRIHAQAYHAIPFALQNPQAQARLQAILRRHSGGDKPFLTSLGNPRVLTDAEEFFSQDLDMVDVCTPNHLHFAQVMAALAKGLPVYCEKPLSANFEQARQMADAAECAGLPTHMAFNMRYYPAVQQARAILASGALGEVYNFRAYLFHNSYMDAARPTSWRLQKDVSGGGALADLGVHMLDLLRYLLGEYSWVQCRTRTFIPSRPAAPGSDAMVPVDVDDWALCTLGMQSSATGSLEVTRMSGGVTDTERVQIFASEGSLEIDFNNPLNVIYYDARRQQTLSGARDFPTPADQPRLGDIYPPAKLSMGLFIDSHFACIMDFLTSLRSGRPCPPDFVDGFKAQEILTAAYLSAANAGATVNLPIE